MIEQHISRGNMIKTVLLRMGLSMCVLCAMFFVPAGSPAYWEAWVYLAVLVIPMALTFIYLLKTDPALLERRLKTKEKEARQKWIIGLSFLYFFPAFLAPGFDKQFGWSDVSVSVVIGADILVLIGYGICFLAMRENRYASRVVEVEKGIGIVPGNDSRSRDHPPVGRKDQERGRRAGQETRRISGIHEKDQISSGALPLVVQMGPG